MTGRFEMGSTIVLIWESAPDTCVHVNEGDKVQLGQSLVTVKK
jgi:biotin carboxyl carrier protein